MSAIPFNYPKSTDFQTWKSEFEKSFDATLKELNRPVTELVSPYHQLTKFVFKANGGVAIYVAGVLKVEWNP